MVWASAVGLGLPVLYVFSLGTCLLGNPRANAKELAYFATDSTATVLLHAFVARYGGWEGLTYLVLSMAFGNGFLMHPLIGFWLMQHLCTGGEVDRQPASDGAVLSLQPTVSYSGSCLWNWLNFNQLSHVEHHDFSRLSWTKAPWLRATAPEFFNDQHTVPSVRALIKHWVMTKGDKLNFGCVGYDPDNPPPLSVPPRRQAQQGRNKKAE